MLHCRKPQLEQRTLWSANLLFALLLLTPIQLNAQVRIPAEALRDEASIHLAVEKGEQLEQTGRWGEALTYYEDAVRDFPGEPIFETKKRDARRHYDVARRYTDSSFVKSVREMSKTQAIQLYDEVLYKIQSSYVNNPNWSDLVLQGIGQLDISLSESAFRAVNAQNASEQQILATRQHLNETVPWQRVRSRQEARDMAIYTASIASQKLGISESATILEFVAAAAGSLDPYSTFLTPDQLTELYSQIEGNFVGLGVVLKADNGTLLIVNSITGSPAATAGIQAGDRITAVEGQTTQQLTTDKAADMLKGAIGSSVRITVLSPVNTSRELLVKRDRIDVPSIEHTKIIDAQAGVGYLKITSFQKTTARDLTASLWKLHRLGMRALVIDLRGNPGGLLSASVDMADLFLDQGTIVTTRGRSAREDADYTAHSTGTWRVPLVVLIDSNSASASEILAGAIHDHHRGTIVGERSYGKGSVQGIFPLGVSSAGLRLTTAKFYSPSGQAISKRGVTPDVVVQIVAKPLVTNNQVTLIEPKRDATLAAGVTAALNQLNTPKVSNRVLGQR
ncbi:MAG: S41 family peptidase [Pirellulales bacterium]